MKRINRSETDTYMLYTGGTTGMPKGVVWRHQDVVMALGGGVDITTGIKLTEPHQFVEKGRNGFHLCGLPIAPLMHGATQWSVMGQSFIGNKVVLRAKFDPADVFRTIDAEKVNLVMLMLAALSRSTSPVGVPSYSTVGDEKRGMRVPGAYAITVRYCAPLVPMKRLPTE